MSGPYGNFNSAPPGYKQESSGGNITDGKVYLGIVKDNEDVQKMGRLAVYIPEFGGDPDDESKWIVCSYASPFAGASNVYENVNDSTSMDNTQTSYGFWMIPPDINNEVLVLFLKGGVTNAVWFACLYQQNMNHMVPGIASNTSFQSGEQGVLPPVAEYNKASSSVSANKPIRPRFDPLHDGLSAQGLYSDFERGPASSSARRESPSEVFGFITPRSNHFYIDDNQDNEFIRIRTRSGTQILVHETNGYVYINSGLGNSWIEVSDAGVDIYSKGNISLRSEQDLNIRADKNVNIDAGQAINMTSGAAFSVESGSTLNLSSVSDTNVLSNTMLNLKANGSLRLEASQNVSERAGNSILHTASSKIHQKAGTINRDGMTYDNGGNAAEADSATTPTAIKRTPQADVKNGPITTPVSRMPTHEPFALHPKSKDLDPPRGDYLGEDPSVKGTGGQLSPFPIEKTTNATDHIPTKQQKTGEGDTKTVDVDVNKAAQKINIGQFKVADYVIAAIKRASDITGIDYGYMMAMAEKESSFNPNAKASTSSASGLYQIIDKTWAALVSSYGSKYDVASGDRFDAAKNALMAAFLTKENKTALARKGITSPGPTDLYIAHFAGPVTAAKILLADSNATGVSVAGDAAANANKSIFYSKSGSPKTCGEIIAYFKNFISPRAIAYANVTVSTG